MFENEAAEADLMRRPPRAPDAPLFGANVVVLAMSQGLVALLAVLAAYGWALSALSEGQARAFAFTVLVVANLASIFSNRSRSRSPLASLRSPNPILWLVAGAALALLALLLYQPWLAAVFRFAPLGAGQLGAAAGIGLASLACLELLKPLGKRRRPP